MKIYLFLAFVFASRLVAFGEFDEKELKHFKKNVEIAGVHEDTYKNDDREKSETLEVNTFQDSDDPLEFDMSLFRIHFVVELTDKQKNTYLVQFKGKPSADYDSEYQGEDYWTLYMPHGDIERLKISGYMVRYGIMDDDTFVLLAEEEDHSEKMREGVINRTTHLFPGTVRLRHYYMYDDSNDGVTESIPANVKKVK
jgi:hypothetical protein